MKKFNIKKLAVNGYQKVGTITRNTFTATKSRLKKLPKATLIAVTVLAIVTFGATAYYSGITNTFNRAQEPNVEVNIEPKIATPPSAIPTEPEVIGTPSFPEDEDEQEALGNVEQGSHNENDMSAEKAEINLIMPTKGEIIREYGFNHSKTFNDYRFHDGIDIAAVKSQVAAAAQGKITSITHTDMEKYTIVIDHGSNLQTHYKHMGEVEVEKGDHVEEGQTIGIITEPGLWDKDTGPHLHFSITYKDEKVNPEKYLN